ncbi:putative YCII-related domain containing protein [Lyophyllum shimeji]|uniref:YCII-related domain containing protein n=1 Tax=Lyophyllum shimeji TaxID=47721 RepID=A0A9P3PJE4_LYOSH|nr:putative YCII-related domain containing protein [Lyophyllum shimeji]
MASQASLPRFFVYAPDSKEAGTHAKRYEVRAHHLKEIQPHMDSGMVAVAGMLVTPKDVAQAGEGQKKAEASILIIKAETIDEVRSLIERDIYYTSGVWDKEKLVILPFFPATKFP